MENNHTIHNKTPYTWYYRNLTCDDSDNELPGHSSRECTAAKLENDILVLKYGNHNNWDLRCEVNEYAGSFDLRESDDHQRFELVSVVDSCPKDPSRITRLEEERRRRDEEERRCQAQQQARYQASAEPVNEAIGGCVRTRKEAKDKYEELLKMMSLMDITENDASVIKTYKLGMVGTYNDIIQLRKENGSVNNNNNADHIPPINTFKKASQILDQNPSARQELQEKNPKLYQMMDGKGTHGLCREVLTPHHRLALTTGNGKEAHLIRQKLAEKFVQGDVVTGMKMSLMASNPEVSQRLMRDADWLDVISKEATMRYHDIGDKLLVEKYYEMGVIDRQGKEKLHKWLNDRKLYSTNTPVYRELLNNLRELKRSLENRQMKK